MLYLNHPTLIKLIGYSKKYFHNINTIVIIMDYAVNRSLDKILHKKDSPIKITNTNRQIILVGIARGMKYLHDRHYKHRDLKPKNVLLDENLYPKIADFGLSKYFEVGHSYSNSGVFGSLLYEAPELLGGEEEYGPEVDVFSFAILMYEVVTNLIPYAKNGIGKPSFNQIKIYEGKLRPKFYNPIKKSVQQLIEQCWDNDPKKRPSFKEIFQKLTSKEYFLDDVDEEKLNDYIAQITVIKDPIDKYLHKIDLLEEENQQLKEENKQLNENKEQKESQIDDLKNDDQLNEAKLEIDQLKERINLIMAENKKLTDNNVELAAANEKLLNEKVQMEDEIAKINHDKEILIQENENIRKEKEQLTEKEQTKPEKKKEPNENDDDTTTSNNNNDDDNDLKIINTKAHDRNEKEEDYIDDFDKYLANNFIYTYNSQANKINVVIIGHMNSGKSTLVGRILFNLKVITKDALNKKGTKGNVYSSFVDDNINKSTSKTAHDASYHLIKSRNRAYSLINVSGKPDKIESVIYGAEQANAAILVIDSSNQVYSNEIPVQYQVREQALIAYAYGIKQLIIAVNKMDDDFVNYNKKKFYDIKKKIAQILTDIGYQPGMFRFVPISGYFNCNLNEKSPKLNWWNGGTLLDEMNKFYPLNYPLKKPLRVVVRDVCNINDFGTFPVGSIESGILKKDQNIIIAPSNIRTKVDVIRMSKCFQTQVHAGTTAGFSVNVPLTDIKCGDVCGEIDNDPPKECIDFVADLTITCDINKICPGFEADFYLNGICVNCKIVKFIKRLDNDDKNGDRVFVLVKPSKSIVVESFNDYPELSKFVVCDNNKRLVAIGKVVTVQKK